MQWWISDIHLGRGSSNEFQAPDELMAFLKAQPDHSGILNGDIFELLKDDKLEDIVAYWKDLVKLLFQKAKVYVVGNHDRFMLDSSFSPPQFMGVPLCRYFIEGRIMSMHGHLFDPANIDFVGNHLFGDTITGIVGWLSENITPDINELSRQLEKLVRNIGRNGDPSYYRVCALNFIEHVIVDWHRLDTIILGHTHIKEDKIIWNDRFTYYNTGTFGLAGHLDVLELPD